MSYVETIKKWDEVGFKNELGAIHPAGLVSETDFWRSGEHDAAMVAAEVKALGLDPSTLSIADYGCGFGRVSYSLADRFKAVVAWDSSRYMMDGLRAGALAFEKWPNNFFIHCGMHAPDNDIAVSISVFIHHTYADGVKMMKEVASMVKEGGYLLLQIPIYDVAKEPEHWTGVGVWTKEMLVTAVKEAGLWIVEMWSSPGAFSYDQVGVNHHKFQVLQKVS